MSIQNVNRLYVLIILTRKEIYIFLFFKLKTIKRGSTYAGYMENTDMPILIILYGGLFCDMSWSVKVMYIREVRIKSRLIICSILKPRFHISVAAWCMHSVQCAMLDLHIISGTLP